MPTKRSGDNANSGGGGKALDSNGTKGALEEAGMFDRMRTVLHWIDHFFQKHGMLESRKGLYSDAKRVFEISESELQNDLVFKNPLEGLRVLAHKGDLESVLREFENVCPPKVDKGPNSQFNKVLDMLKVQIALQNIRMKPPAIDEYEKCVKLLVVANDQPSTSKSSKDLQKELLDVIDSMKKATSEQKEGIVAELLKKYSKDDFLGTFDKFVVAHQPETMLDTVVSDIDSGRYVPSDDTGECETEKKKTSADKSAPVHRPRKVLLSAWQLRKGLGFGEDEDAWAHIHQETHPDVISFVKSVAKASETQSKKRPRAENGTKEVETKEVNVPRQTRKVDLAVSKKSAPNGVAPKKNTSDILQECTKKSSKKEDNREELEVVQALRESRRALLSTATDPLDSVRRIAATANVRVKETPTQPQKKRGRFLDPKDPGRKCEWSSDDEVDPKPSEVKNSTIRLSSPSSYKPKVRLGQTTPTSTRLKWTDEEVENLKKGVQRFGVGNWKQILEEYHFQKGRTNVHLKDKYRNLVDND